MNAAGDLTPNARARRDAFVEAVDQIDSDRFRMVLDFLRRQKVTEDELTAFLTGILRRFALEEDRLEEATGSRGRRRFARDLAADQLRDRRYVAGSENQPCSAGARSTHRRDRSRPRFGGRSGRVRFLSTAIHPAVRSARYRFAHGRRDGHRRPNDGGGFESADCVAPSNHRLRKAGVGPHYVLQLPRASSAGWNTAAVAYWQHFGETIGTARNALAAPPGIELRAVAVKRAIATRIIVDDLDIVTQTLDTVPGRDSI